MGLSSGLSVCSRFRFQYCPRDRFWVISVVYRSQIGRFHTESYPQLPPKWARLFLRLCRKIFGGRQLPDSMKFCGFCRFCIGLAGVNITSECYLHTKLNYTVSRKPANMKMEIPERRIPLGRRHLYARWRHQMETFFGLLVYWVGNSPGTGEFPAQRPVTRSF